MTRQSLDRARRILSIESPRTSNALETSPSSARSTSTYSSILDKTRPFAAFDAVRERPRSRDLVSLPVRDPSSRASSERERTRASEATGRARASNRSIRSSARDARRARLTHPRARRPPRPRALAPPPCSCSLARVSRTRRTRAVRGRLKSAPRAGLARHRGLATSPDSWDNT